MSPRELVTRFWADMQANDWDRAAAHLAPDCAVDWPCSGERFVGREAFAAVQSSYPSRTHRWSFQVHRLVDDGDTVVSEVTVTDGEQCARVVTFSDIVDDQITHHVEYWPAPYDPRPERDSLSQRIERIP